MAVLELQNKLKGAEREAVDGGFFGNEVRAAALEALPGLDLMTRENVITLLAATGKKLEECEGECEVETGRRLGADWVVSGELVKLGSTLRLGLRLHETKAGRLLAGTSASGKDAEALDAAIPAAVRKLLAPLGALAPEAPRPASPPVPAKVPPPSAAEAKEAARVAPAAQAPQAGGGEVRFLQQPQFLTAKGELKAESGAELDRVAQVLAARPGLRLVVECHSDNRGRDEANLQLTQRRAEAVVARLVRAGVEASRLEARGWGPAKPIDTNSTEQGRARNRRCELHPLP